MMRDETLHVGKDGLDLKGNGSILVGVLMMFMSAVGWMFWNHLDRDERRNVLIEQRMEIMQADHGSIVSSIRTQTEATQALADVMKEQNCILLADERETAKIRRASQWSLDHNAACRKLMTEGH